MPQPPLGVGSMPLRRVRLSAVESVANANHQPRAWYGLWVRYFVYGCGEALHAAIVASDIEDASVKTAEDNMHKNGIDKPLSVRLGHGYDTIQEGETFDLIVSTILAQPLIQMASDLARVLEPGGYAILSGFLEEQFDNVVAAHEQEGLTIVESSIYDGWVTAILKK